MMIDENLNYVILANNINKKFLKNFSEYPVINELSFVNLKNKLEFYTSKRIIFNNTFYALRDFEKKEILKILNK